VGVGGEQAHEPYVEQEQVEQISVGDGGFAAAAVGLKCEMDGGGYQSEDDKDDLEHRARASLFSMCILLRLENPTVLAREFAGETTRGCKIQHLTANDQD
jgi:hypothetical protein